MSPTARMHAVVAHARFNEVPGYLSSLLMEPLARLVKESSVMLVSNTSVSCWLGDTSGPIDVSTAAKIAASESTRHGALWSTVPYCTSQKAQKPTTNVWRA